MLSDLNQNLAHRADHRFDCAGSDGSQAGLDVREHLLDWRQVGIVNRQRFHPRSRRLDCRDCRHALVRRQVVPHHHVAWPKLRRQHLLDILIEGRSIRRAGKAIVATTPDVRRPEINVTFFQTPGAAAITRSPTGARP